MEIDSDISADYSNVIGPALLVSLNLIRDLNIQTLIRQPFHFGQREASGERDLSKAVSLLLHDRRIEVVEGLEICPNLRILDLSFNRLSKVEGLSSLLKLKELKLYDNMITEVGSGLQPLSALHTLDMSSNRISDVQGLGVLRGLKVLRLAHNRLTTLEGLGRATQLEVLDISNNAIKDLAGLSSCIALKEIVADGNQLVNFKGIQRCHGLVELHVADNQLTSLQGLKNASGTLDILNIASNRLTSLDSLADGFATLSELYLSGNTVSGLGSLPNKAPNLETLDAAFNQLHDLDALVSELSGLPSLSSARLEGNRGLPPGYPEEVLARVGWLDSVDGAERAPPPPDVLVIDGGAEGETEELTSRFEPTQAEMEQYKRKMGISSALPVMGRPVTPLSSSTRPPSAHALLRSIVTVGLSTGILRPGTASGTGVLLPPSTPGRPGTSGGTVRDVMMYQRAPSAAVRTGGTAPLMKPEEYHEQVAGFRDTMEQYSLKLKSALATIKNGLQLDAASATAQMKAPGAASARNLPAIPMMPEIPLAGRDGGTANRATGVTSSSQARRQPSGSAAAAASPAATTTPPPPAAAPSRPPLARNPELDAPEVAEALQMYRRLFPDCQQPQPSQPLPSTSEGPIDGYAPVSNLGTQLDVTTTAASDRGRSTAAGNSGGGGEGDGGMGESSDDDRDEVIRGGGEEEDENDGDGGGGRVLMGSAVPSIHSTGTAGPTATTGTQLKPRLGGGFAGMVNGAVNSPTGARPSGTPSNTAVAAGKGPAGAAQQRPLSAGLAGGAGKRVGPKARLQQQQQQFR